MSVVALSAPSTAFGGLSGLAIPASGTTLAGNTGFTVPNNGLVMIVAFIGASGAGNWQFLTQRGASQPAAIAVSNSTNYIFGPFDPVLYSDSAGLLNVTTSVVTGNSVAAYVLQSTASFRAVHNPFQNNLTLPDS